MRGCPGVNVADSATKAIDLGPWSPNLFPSAIQHPSGGPILSPSIADESGGIGLMDPFLVRSGGTVYLFYAAVDATRWHINALVATTTEAEYPLGWTKQGAVLRAGRDLAGLWSPYVAGPVVFQLPDLSWRMYAHIYASDGNDLPVVFSTSADAFPGGWDTGTLLWTASPGTWYSKHIHPQSVIPPWDAYDGKWHIFSACMPTTGYTWQAGEWTSMDGITGWTMTAGAPSFTFSGGTGWDGLGVHPIGHIVKLNGWFYGCYSGYDGDSWRSGMWCGRDIAQGVLKNPVGLMMDYGAPGSWNAGSREAPTLHAVPGTDKFDIWSCDCRVQASPYDYCLSVCRVGGW
jgi:hypothetical protein